MLVDLLNHLDPDSMDISLVTTTGGVHEKRLPTYVKYNKIIKCDYKKRSEILSKIINKLPASIYAWLFLPGQFDIEIAYLEGKTTQHIAKKRTGAKKIAFVHCDLSVNDMLSKVYTDPAGCITEYRSFDKVCFVAEDNRDGFFEAYGELSNSCILHNFIDFDKVKLLSEKLPDMVYESNGWKLIAVGRLAPPKAYDRLLRIVSELETETQLELWIVGEGEERSKLEKIIQELNLHSVKLLGFHDNPYPLIKQADFMVCSSLSEGYSTAVAEAIALGVPVITTKCSGMSELLAHGEYGIIIENSEESLSEGLRELLNNKEQFGSLKQNVQRRSQEVSSKKALNEFMNMMNMVSDTV